VGDGANQGVGVTVETAAPAHAAAAQPAVGDALVRFVGIGKSTTCTSTCGVASS
jgi:hypothetical protein